MKLNLKKGLGHKISMSVSTLGLAVGAMGLLASCTKSPIPDMHKEPNIEVIQDMMEQDALKAQDFMPGDRMKASSRTPPAGTVSIGYKPYAYHLDPASAAAKLKNPFAGNTSAEILSLGRTKFETYCAVCHGYQGKGDGPVSVKMALKPPPLISDKIQKLADGGIFHIITDGQGVMSSYAYQLVEENDRWAIVQYVRSLQRLANGSASTEPKTK